jgi:hypothetical protein
MYFPGNQQPFLMKTVGAELLPLALLPPLPALPALPPPALASTAAATSEPASAIKGSTDDVSGVT